MIIDFSEITDHTRFEFFVQEYLQLMGYHIVHEPGIGPDDGKDMIANLTVEGLTFRMLVSCKHHKSAVREDSSNLSKLSQHRCTGFLYIYSSYATSPLIKQIKESCGVSNTPNRIIYGEIIERDLIEIPAMRGLIYRYFPKTHRRISGIWNINECPRCLHYTQGDISAFPFQSSNGEPLLEIACGGCAPYNLPDELLLGPSFTIVRDPHTL